MIRIGAEWHVGKNEGGRMKWFRRLLERKQKEQPKSTTKEDSNPKEASVGNCSNCGLPLRTRVVTQSASRSVDDTRRVEQQVLVTQLFCSKCNLVANDDYYGDVAKAFQRIDRICPAQPLDTALQEVVSQAIHKAQALASSTDVEIEAGFNSVKYAWDAPKVLTVQPSHVEELLAALFQGNSQEGYSRNVLEVKDNKVLQVNALGPAFRPYRILRTTAGSFAVYGHVSLYRFSVLS